jgi:transposase-like protein
MRAEQFKALLANLGTLRPAQLEKLLAEAGPLHTSNESLRTIEGAGATGCISCGSSRVVKNGTARGLQRYLCRGCGRTFSRTSGTPLAGLRNKERFIEQGRHLASGLTVRQSAAAMGVSLGTALSWRHRFLAAGVGHQGKALTGMLEADETFLRENCKGSRSLTRPARRSGGILVRSEAEMSKKGAARAVPVLVLHMRGQPYVADRVLGTTSLTKVDALDALREWVSPDALLCVDGGGAFRTVEKELGIKVEAVAVAYEGRTRVGPEGVFHIQTVNGYHERLKTWIDRQLRGVATKNLPLYLAWMRIQEWFKDGVKPEHYLLTALNRQVINT